MVLVIPTIKDCFLVVSYLYFFLHLFVLLYIILHFHKNLNLNLSYAQPFYHLSHT